jgi:glycosyltransferase 2 family protein
VQRRRLLWAVNLALGLAALAWVLRQFGRGALDVLSTRPAIGPLVAFVVAVLAAIVLSALRWRVVLGAFPNAPGLGRLFAYRAASQSLASILPGGRVGGEPLRVWYAMQAGVPTPIAVTSVVVDRTLEMATGLPFVVAFALVLATRNVPGIEQAVIGAVVGIASLGVATMAGIRRLRRGGLFAPLVEALGKSRPGIAQHAGLVALAEDAARRLLDEPRRLAVALAIGVAADLLTLVQYACLLAAFGLPHEPIAVVAAVFASGAARMLPVPGAVGTVEAAEVWIFGVLGHPPEVGLAVGIATRLRDLVWAAPGLTYFLVRALRPPADVVAPPALADADPPA